MPTEKQNIAHIKKQIKEYEEAAKNFSKAQAEHPEYSTRYAAKAASAAITAAALTDVLKFIEGE